MARITRKELKTDKFALEVEHTVTFFEEHGKEILRYGGIVAVVVLLGGGFYVFRHRQAAAREAALSRAIEVQEAPVGPPPAGSTTISAFPTQQVKDEAATQVFNSVKNQYAGSTEATIAQYYLGSIQADQGKFSDAEKSFQAVAANGNDQYASLAKLSLAQVYYAEGKMDQGQKVFEDLMAHPTVFVSKEQAQVSMARVLIPIRPAEARKILDTLRNTPGAVSQVALQLYAQLPPQ
ncbi:MAG: tetratricopeptide repeat protein [Acidobacteriia bacterium]|nr:tetratricopeptide repeat protein [Terriglobia bacterium]